MIAANAMHFMLQKINKYMFDKVFGNIYLLFVERLEKTHQLKESSPFDIITFRGDRS